MLITVQGTTPKYSSSDVQHWTALMATSVCFIHRSITAPSLAIFSSAAAGTRSVDTYLLDGLELRLRGGIVILHALDAAQDFREVDASRPKCLGLQDLFAVADGVERGRTRADGADAQIRAGRAPRGRPRRTNQVLPEFVRIRRSVCSVVSEYGMPYCVRLLQADILPQKLSRRSRMVIFAGVSGVACTSTGT